MRLLQLPDEVLSHVRSGALSAGHARALITTDNPVELARKVLAEGLSVRQVESLAKASGAQKPSARTPLQRSAEKDADTRALEQDLSANLGMQVTIDHRSGAHGGQLVIGYPSLEALDELCRALTASPLRRTR
jgi:ParB family chromosome partitioning protein